MSTTEETLRARPERGRAVTLVLRLPPAVDRSGTSPHLVVTADRFCRKRERQVFLTRGLIGHHVGLRQIRRMYARRWRAEDETLLWTSLARGRFLTSSYVARAAHAPARSHQHPQTSDRPRGGLQPRAPAARGLGHRQAATAPGLSQTVGEAIFVVVASCEPSEAVSRACWGPSVVRGTQCRPIVTTRRRSKNHGLFRGLLAKKGDMLRRIAGPLTYTPLKPVSHSLRSDVSGWELEMFPGALR
jgi:hypothetical protein